MANSGMTEVAALIVAAGRGQRVGGAVPKQYLPLAGGRPVLHHTLHALGSHPRVQLIRVAIHPDDADLYAHAIEGLPQDVTTKLLPTVAGGASRQESVRHGLESLTGLNPRLVLIHDGARPLVSPAQIDKVIAALATSDGAILALRVTDTLKREGKTGEIVGTVDRSQLWRALTPQGFLFAAILAAHRTAAHGPELTDDAAVAERAGLRVALVEGEERNLKITRPEDFERAAHILAIAERSAESMTIAFEPRTGQGIDVHRFGPGDHVMICGVRVPHDAGVIAHSDGDVGLHALVDAILGALGAGDIGRHFPPSDPQWRHADSSRFVAHAVGLAQARGARIVHVDITMLCERPRIGPHRDAMIARLSALLGITGDRISVKATTTERLGFTGRKEGLAAQAIATLLVPVTSPP